MNCRKSRVAQTRGGDPTGVAESPVVGIACVKMIRQGFHSILKNNNNKLYDVTFSKSDLLCSYLSVVVEVHQDEILISPHNYLNNLFFFATFNTICIENVPVFVSIYLVFFKMMDH